jgi:hypothetical protein
MASYPRNSLKLGGSIIATAALLAVAVLAVLDYASAPKSVSRVDELVSGYEANRERFSNIERLASVDATFGIDVDRLRFAGDGVSSTDVPDYGEILETLQAVGAVRVSASDHALELTTHSEGLAVSGRNSGYFYSTASDVETVTLEVARSPEAPRNWLYPLGNGWYAFDYSY